MKYLYASTLILILISVLGAGSAGTIYHYKDENGIQRFSDTPPQTDQSVATCESFASPSEQKNHVFVRKTNQGGHTQLIIVNELYGPAEVELFFDELTNLISTPPLPKRFVVPGRKEMTAVDLRIEKPDLASHYRYRYRYILGPPGARHAPSLPYRPPFLKGQRYKVTQAFNGGFSHNEEHSRFAVDFLMPEGTPIVCARDGMVVVREHDHVGAGLNKDYYEERINHIRILHNDGTIAFYGHLKRGSARVRCGEQVTAGQIIAESGNTGYSSGPHLHFAIQKNEDLRWLSVSFVFKGPNGENITPKEGQLLEAW